MPIANVKMCANYYISDFKTINCNSNVIWVYNECEERMKWFFSFIASICYAIECVHACYSRHKIKKTVVTFSVVSKIFGGRVT